MAEKEGWSKEKVFDLLKDPAKLVKTMEHVRISKLIRVGMVAPLVRLLPTNN